MNSNAYGRDRPILMDRTQSDDSIFDNSMRNNATMYPLYCSINHELIYESLPSGKPPKIINGYLFGDVLGQGSYGKVKELVDETSLVKRAVKIVDYYMLRKRRNGIANLEKEIRVMSRLKHTNVVRLIETFSCSEKNKTYIVMEYCFGNVETLINSTSSHRLTEPDAHYLFTQLIDGLEHIHSYGIIHNDIKPTNLLLSGNFVLKICDFGVAEELTFHREDDSICTDDGTPAFKAPEAINSNTHEFSGFKVDIFAAGVTLFYMICGKLPWEAPSQQVLTLFKKICEEHYIFPDFIKPKPSEDVKVLIAVMLEKNPQKRVSLHGIKSYPWFLRSFQDEYAMFQVVNYDAFYPKSVIKQKLEMLFGEPLHFPSLENRDNWPEVNASGRTSLSAPDLSPRKHDAFDNLRNPTSSHGVRRRSSFFKWFKKK